MTETVELEFAQGGNIAVQIEESGTATRGGLDDDASQKVTQSFDTALGSVRNIAESLHGALTGVVNAPDNVTVTFGISFSASAGVIIAKGEGGANLNITMAWDRTDAT